MVGPLKNTSRLPIKVEFSIVFIKGIGVAQNIVSFESRLGKAFVAVEILHAFRLILGRGHE